MSVVEAPTVAEHRDIEHREIELPDQLGLVRRTTKHRWLDHYKRLVLGVTVANVVVLVLAITRWGWFSTDGLALAMLSRMVVINLTVAVLFRQQYVINLLFRVAMAMPTSWPLKLRWHAAKVYHFGGIHSAGATAATVWFIVFTVGVLFHSAVELPADAIVVSGPLVVVSALIVMLMVSMVVTALPSARRRFHNRFELIHRLVGWGVLALFWIQTVLFALATRGEESLGSALLYSEGIWALAVITVSVALPWLRLKKVPVDIERPSNHVALARFNYGVTPFAGSSTPLSRSPFTEWHQFANVPAPGEDGFRLTISRAGDWTGAFIDDIPEHVWVKGIPTAGVGNVEQIFKKVVWVATGSGIGPCLPHLLANNVPSTLVWSTRTPRETYGDQLVDDILAVQDNPIIWDTVEHGKPDMVRLAYRAYVESGAEAVICIANQKLTRQVVWGMESRGIPAYGAIWDS